MNVGDLMVSVGLDLAKLKTAFGDMMAQAKTAGAEMKTAIQDSLNVQNFKIKVTPEVEQAKGSASIGKSSGGGGEGEGWTSMGGSNNLMYAGMTAGAAALPLDMGIKAALSTYTQFDQAIANVNSMMDLTPAKVDALKQQVLELSKTVPGGPVALTNALYGIVGAGIPAGDAMTFLKTAAQTATAGATDTTTATSALIAVMNSYGLKAKDIGSISDTMFAANAAGAMTFNDFASSVGTVAGPAAQAGVSFKEVAGATAALTNEGLSAQRSTMGLRALLMGIMAPTAGASKEAKKLGLEWDANTLKSKGMTGMLQEAMTATGGNAQELKKLIPNIAAWTVAVDLGGKGAGAYKTAMDTMANSAGATGRALQAQEAGAGQQLEMMKSAIQTAQIAFVQGFAPAIAQVAGIVGKLATAFANMSPQSRKIIGDIALGAAAFLTFSGAMLLAASAVGQIKGGLQTLGLIGKIGKDGEKAAGLIGKAFSGLGSVFAKLGGALMANPMLLVWGLIAVAVIALVYLVITHWSQISAFLSKTWNDISGIAKNVWNGITGFFKGMFDDVMNVFHAFVEGFTNGFYPMQTGAETVAAWIGNAFYVVGQFITNAWNGVLAFFRQWGPWMLAALGGPVGIITKLIIDNWGAITKFLSDSWNTIKNLAATIWNDIKNGVVGAFEWMYNHNYYFKDLVDFITTTWTELVSTAKTVWNAVTGALQTAWQAVQTAATVTWNAITSFLKTTWNDVIATAQAVWGALSDWFTTTWNDIVKIATAIFVPVEQFFEDRWNNIKTGLETAWKAITGVATAAWNGLIAAAKAVILPIVSWIGDRWTDISNGVSAAWSAIKSAISTAAVSAVEGLEVPFKALGSFFAGVWKDAVQWGENIINSIGDGIKKAAGAVENAVKSVAGSIADFLGFHSPAKKGPGSTADKWMPNLMNMLIDGIKKAIPQLESTMKTVLSGTPAQMQAQGKTIVQGLVKGMLAAKPLVVSAAQQIADGLKSVMAINLPNVQQAAAGMSADKLMQMGFMNGNSGNAKLVDYLSSDANMAKVKDMVAAQYASLASSSYGQKYTTDVLQSMAEANVNALLNNQKTQYGDNAPGGSGPVIHIHGDIYGYNDFAAKVGGVIQSHGADLLASSVKQSARAI